MRRKTGSYVISTTGGEKVKAFIPDQLPPSPGLRFDEEHYDLLEKANRALGRLDGIYLASVPWAVLRHLACNFTGFSR
jgi:hypothetical protein